MQIVISDKNYINHSQITNLRFKYKLNNLNKEQVLQLSVNNEQGIKIKE